MLLLFVSCKREQRSAPKPETWSAPPAKTANHGEWTWSEVGPLAQSPLTMPAIGRALPFSHAVVWGRPPQRFDAKLRAFHAAPAWPACADAHVAEEQLAVMDDELVFAVGAKCGYDAEEDKWLPVPELSPKGPGWAATPLSKNDVLMTGTEASLWDHKQKTIVTLPATKLPHTASLLLLDGTVLLTSKKGEKMELYEPSSRTFRLIDEQRFDGRPAVIGDGRVMFLTNDGSCGLYDPASTKSSTCPSLNTPRTDFALTVVADGVLITGGTAANVPTAAVELYDPRKDAWLELPPMPVVRTRHVALRLSDESVLVAGGSGGTDPKRAFVLTHTTADAGP